MRFASATISSVLLFSRLTGLFGHGELEPGEKIDALQPFPIGQISIRYPLWSMTVIFFNRHFDRQWFLDDRRLMLPSFDAVANDGGLAQRLGGLKPVQALDQYEARAVRAHQDRRLLALREHAVRDRIDALQVERFAPCCRHVDIGDREGLAFQHVGEGSTVARAVRRTSTKPSITRFS